MRRGQRLGLRFTLDHLFLESVLPEPTWSVGGPSSAPSVPVHTYTYSLTAFPDVSKADAGFVGVRLRGR